MIPYFTMLSIRPYMTITKRGCAVIQFYGAASRHNYEKKLGVSFVFF